MSVNVSVEKSVVGLGFGVYTCVPRMGGGAFTKLCMLTSLRAAGG